MSIEFFITKTMLKIKKSGPLLEPTKHKFERAGVLNPAVIDVNGKLHMVYRAVNHRNYSSFGYSLLSSPEFVEVRHPAPVMFPQEIYESCGIEDPRLVHIDGLFYLTYTSYDGKNALGSLATSLDLVTFIRHGVITPQVTYRDYQSCIECCDGLNDKYMRFIKIFYEHSANEAEKDLFIWDKDLVFFPRKINGKFAFMHRIYPDIQVAYFDLLSDLTYQFWKDYLVNLKDHIMLAGRLSFEASYIGGGCPPIETSEGWLIIYHGVEDTRQGYVYHACAALMDIDDPTRELGRLQYPLFSPELDWEKYGVVKNVVFPTGAIVRDGTLYIYYGAADKRIGVVSVDLELLMDEILKQK
jgi:beta-1,2-mannobiose phosphorylase / 1,2-beta-oligomannan phosphorylase